MTMGTFFFSISFQKEERQFREELDEPMVFPIWNLAKRRNKQKQKTENRKQKHRGRPLPVPPISLCSLCPVPTLTLTLELGLRQGLQSLSPRLCAFPRNSGRPPRSGSRRAGGRSSTCRGPATTAPPRPASAGRSARR